MSRISINNGLKKDIIIKIIPFMICSVIISVICILNINFKLKEESRTHILEVNKQIAKSVQDKLENNIKNIKKLSSNIETINDEDKREKFMKNIHEYNKSTLFKSLHVVDTDGYTMCEDKDIYLGDRDYFKKAISGKDSISIPIESRISKENVINFAVPIEIDGEVIGVLEGADKLENVRDSLVTSIYFNENSKSKSSMYIYDNNFNLIVSSLQDEYIGLSKKDLKDKVIHNDINETKIRGIDKYIADTDIFGSGDWHLITTIPVESVVKNSNNVIFFIILLVTFLNIAFLIVNIWITTSKYKYKEKLKNMAFKDKVTGVNNYEKFIIDTEDMLKNSKDNFAIICFDFRRFKFINQVFGYSVGDEMLKRIAKNIPKYVYGKYKYARLGNDLFAIAIRVGEHGVTIDEIAHIIKNNIVTDGIYEEILKSKDIKIETSIGVYFVEDNHKDIKVMVDYADLARQKCKELNRSSHYIFEKELLEEKEEEVMIERSIAKGLRNNEFKVYYQPKVCTRTNKVVGAEALIRWIREDGGFISPGKFIPIAEKCGSIKLIGKWVLEQVCKDLSEWKDKGYNLVPISINISRVELYQSDLITHIEKTLKKYNLDSNLLEIEITETTALNDVEYINSKINAMKNLGIKVSMDDFGTGNSTLSNLKRIDIDILKIDRSFLIDIEDDDKSKYMVSAIIELSKKLGYDVVCEGVEYKEQVRILKGMDCDIIQGFVFYRPMNSLEIEKIIKEL